MKIIFVTLGFSPYRNSGFDVSGERYVKLLLENGLDITVIAASNSKTTEIIKSPNLRIVRVPIDKTNWIGYAIRASRVASKLDGVVHFWDIYLAYPYRYEFVASLHQSFNQRLQILNNQKVNFPTLTMRKLYYLFAKQLAEIPSLKKSRYLFAVSNTTRIEYIDNYKVDENKVILAPHFIDPEFFSKKTDLDKIRTHFGIKEGVPVLLFVGFINQRKGIDTLLKAIEIINTDLYFLIIGKWQSERYRRSVFSKINPALREKIIEVGYVPDELMPYFYSLADVYVTTSLLEGFGLPIAEAVSCETPVIALDSGATKEVLGPGGVVLPNTEIYTISNAIQRLIKDQDLRQRLGKAGREHVVREFSKENLLSRVLRIYEELS
ncbi:MAG: glycosyltransferase family 4 protein [Bacteroidota bacterium]